MSIPSIGGVARQYLASFEGDDFEPNTLKDSGLLSSAGKTLMASIPAQNLAVEAQAMKSGLDLEKQAGYNETLLAIQELKNDQAKKNAIINQLSGTGMAGAALTQFLGGSKGGFDTGALMPSFESGSSKTPINMPTKTMTKPDEMISDIKSLSNEERAKVVEGIKQLLVGD